MNSIFHFFKHLVLNKDSFAIVEKLENFPYDENMLSCKNSGIFPDMAIRLNNENKLFPGGELIELKDSKSYSIASFNSTIPTGTKEISKIIKGEHSTIKIQMEDAGNHIYSLPIRDVYYLIRGINKGNTKIALIHGSFFETVNSNTLISQSFEQVLEERLEQKGISLGDNLRDVLVDIFSEQDSFSKVRNIDKASVKLRFRIMTEVKAEGNILNSNKYPDIKPNTINLIVPRHSNEDEALSKKRFTNTFDKVEEKRFNIFSIKHLLNGYYTVFQIPI